MLHVYPLYFCSGRKWFKTLNIVFYKKIYQNFQYDKTAIVKQISNGVRKQFSKQNMCLPHKVIVVRIMNSLYSSSHKYCLISL